MTKTRYRAGLLFPPGPWPRWLERIHDGLATLGFEPALYSLNLPGPRPGALFRAYQALDRRLFRIAADPSERLDETATRAKGRITALPPGGDWPAALTRALAQERLDILVVAGRLDIPEPVAAALGLGVLCLDHLDFATGTMPEAFRALAAGEPDFETRLSWIAPGRPARLLYRSRTAVMPLSLGQTSAPARVKGALGVERMARELLRDGPEAWERRAEAMPPDPPAPLPDNLAMAGFIPRLLGRHLDAARLDALYRRQWFVALRRDRQDPFDLRGFEPLFPPPGYGFADPFPVVRQGRTHLFIESIAPKTGLGSIAVLTEDETGRFGPPRTVLAGPGHLSYPFVFEWRGDMYMVPESSSQGEVAIHRARDFPLVWERVGTLLSGVRAVDATLFEHGGRWWLMANIRPEGGSSWDELHLFHGPSPLGPLTAHPKNPVVSDVRRARPGGPVFVRDGRLLRPSQDCSGHYGRALVINEILTLTPEDYREAVVARHGAEVLGLGECLHTYAFAPGIEAVDGQRRAPRFFPLRGASGGGTTPKG